MKIEQLPDGVKLAQTRQFDIAQTFECGQCFRWDRQGDGSYIGIAMGRVLHICQQGNNILLHGTTPEEFEAIWKRYFDLERDYREMQHQLCADRVLKCAVQYGSGIRILAQEPFETLISFIISANNNIPRIRQIIGRLCQNFGEPVIFEDGTYYSFPTPQRLAELKREELGVLRAGFRDKYILDAATKVAAGEVDLDKLRHLPYATAKSELMKIKGVGQKVADCILLFGLGHHNAFPVDVWIRRIVEHCYFEGNALPCELTAFAQNRFGEYGGFAQQYLFYYARELKIAK